MSHVCRWRSAWLAPLLFAGIPSHEAVAKGVPAAKSKSLPPSAVLETFAKSDGQTYFALKLSPPLAPPPATAHDVVVLFDTSASQIGVYRAKALSALRALLAALPAGDRAALLAADVNTIALTPSLVSPSSDAMGQAVAALERRVPLGSTDMTQALERSLAACLGDDTSGGDAGRARCVFYIGDGFSTAHLLSIETLQRLVGRFADQRVSINSYAIGPRIDSELLAALANHTGGMLIPADGSATDRQVGGYLANVARAAVVWPTTTTLPDAIKIVYPQRTPPLRFDRDSILVGAMELPATGERRPLDVAMQGELAGKPVTLHWKATPGQSGPDNAYLTKVVEAAARSGGTALPTVGSAGLSELRRWVQLESQQLTKIGERALAVGQADNAAQLADEAERLDPANAEAATLRAAATRGRKAAADDLKLARASADGRPAADAPVETADVDLLDEVDRQNRVVEGFLRTEVSGALNQASNFMSVDPEAMRDRLKLLLEKVQYSAELNPETRAQLVGKIESGLRTASRMSTIKTERDLRRQQAEAEGEARERIHRQLFAQQQKVDQLMSRFEALMDEERYRDAEVLVEIAKEIEPGNPGLRGAELFSRTVGDQANAVAVREMRHKGFVDAMFQVELANVPMAGDPPILYPDPEAWQLLTERRKKYEAVDLTENGPSETKILAALDENTELDFAEQPLIDVVDYLKNRHDIEIQLDNRALTDAGVGSDTPISRNIKGITLRSALKLVLSELDLTYVLRNEVLMITSKTEAENMLSNRVYPVADLVVPIPPPQRMGMGGGMGGGMLGGGMGGMGGMRGMGGGTGGMMGGGMMGGGMGLGPGGMRGGMGGMFDVPAKPKAARSSGAVHDDLNLGKKRGKKPAGAAKSAAPAKPPVKPPAKPLAKTPRNEKPLAEKLLGEKPLIGKPIGANPAAGPVQKSRRGEKIEPVHINFKEGDDVDAAWNDYFAAHTGDQAPSQASVRETVRRQIKDGKFDQAIGCIFAALRHEQGQPWMYEALCLVMQIDHRPPEEVERVLLSVLDFASTPIEVMYLAQYMARTGLEKRALQLVRQVAQLFPWAPEPYVLGMRLAEKLDDLEAIKWTTLGILSQPWPKRQVEIWEAGLHQAQATLERLRSENRKDEADEYKKAIDEARGRDIVIVVSWTGEADVDLLVEEPAGSVCSFRNPRTLSGGVMLGDEVARSKKSERKAQGAQEAYICPKGFNGEYRILARRVWGKVTADKVTVEVYWHYWSKKERMQRKQIDLSGDEAVCVVNLEDGRRTEPLEEQQVVNAVANTVANQFLVGWQVSQQLNAQNDYGAASSMSRSRANPVGEDPSRLRPPNPFVVSGHTGYMPVITTLPQGAMMYTSAVISADRRYVRVTPMPLFSEVTQVNTFNYVAGTSGTSSGGGGGGGFSSGGRGGSF